MPPKNAYVAYFRVSTKKQGRSGLGLEAQEAAVGFFAKAHGVLIAARYTDIESGKNDDRSQLAAAIAHAEKIGARLVVASLDRLSRDVAYIAAMMKRGVDFVAADMPGASTFELHIRAAIAQEERRKISERTKAALAAAKARGVALGGYRGSSLTEADRAKGRDALASAANAHAHRLAPVVRELRDAGCATYAALADALTTRGCPTPRGGQWSAMQARRLTMRIAV